MRIEQDPKLDFDDVLIRPKRSTLESRRQVSLSRHFPFKHSKRKFQGVPIIAANMDTVGTMNMARSLEKFEMLTALHKHYSEEDLITFFRENNETHFYSMGILDPDLEKFRCVYRTLKAEGKAIAYVCVDVANGYSERFVAFLSALRTDFPDITLMAGNVVTGEMVEQLILNGVDIVKVGIGPGSVCTTRKMTGVGYPQLSAIIECMDAAHGLGGLICADGGCRTPGDIAKAFGAGADFVMLGGMLAGHNECEGEFVREGEKITGMRFYGMSSSSAMDKYAGGVANYRASEGKEVIVPYRGAVEDTLAQILGGIRSACTYTGARSLKELSKCTTFVRVSRILNTVFGDWNGN